MSDEEKFDLIKTQIFGLIIKYVSYRLGLKEFHRIVDELSNIEKFSKSQILEYAKKAIIYEAFEYSKGMKEDKKLAVKNRMNQFIESCENILNENG